MTRFKNKLVVVSLVFVFIGCQMDNISESDRLKSEMSLSEIVDFNFNNEALRFYNNMGDFIQLTTSHITSESAMLLKSATTACADSAVNPILEEFLNLEIEDDDGNLISFFDLNSEERVNFVEMWIKVKAYDLTPKLNDPYFEGTFEEYIKEQNDAFDEAMREFI